MDNNLTDGERLKKVLFALEMSAPDLAKELGYKSHATIYHVLNDTNKISDKMAEAIVAKFPNVNYLYLKLGKGDPLIKNNGDIQNQKNVMYNQPYIDYERLNKIPDQLDKIIDLLEKIVPK